MEKEEKLHYIESVVEEKEMKIEKEKYEPILQSFKVCNVGNAKRFFLFHFHSIFFFFQKKIDFWHD